MPVRGRCCGLPGLRGLVNLLWPALMFQRETYPSFDIALMEKSPIPRLFLLRYVGGCLYLPTILIAKQCHLTN